MALRLICKTVSKIKPSAKKTFRSEQACQNLADQITRCAEGHLQEESAELQK